MVARRLLCGVGRSLLALALLALVLPVWSASAAVPAFRGEYYNNRSLVGAPALVRDDAEVNFNWGAGSPGSPVHADDFSARWTNSVNLAAGTYRFTVRADDGIRLWVDDALIIDRWVLQPATTYTADRTLSAGYHSVRMEYFEASGDAVAQLSWARLGDSSFPEWKAEYYTNPDLAGTPALVRNDAAIDFDWGTGSPAPSIPVDNFSVRWSRSVSLASGGAYTFTVTADDGIRLRVDGRLLIDRWIDQPARTYSANTYLAAGAHDVVVEYYERGGMARAQASWARIASPADTPTVTVDDLDVGFTRGGDLAAFTGFAFGYRDHMFYLWNSTSAVYAWGRWTPNLPGPGRYEVQAFIPSRYAGTSAATYRIYHNGTRHDRTISQAPYYDEWVSLGTYDFDGAGKEYVYLSSATGEAWASRAIGFDAVRFIARSEQPAPPPTCTITPVLGFGSVWASNASVRSALGCATRAESPVWLGEQTFEHGRMFWRQDTATIYVLYDDGTWQQFADSWHTGDPETDPNIVAPAGLYQPKRGFGKVWRENPAVRSKLGWGTIEEHGLNGAVEPFERGLMLWSPQLGIHALYNSGRWQHF